MDHAEAKNIDRYLLGELSAAEADAFEAHYFDCPECTEDLRAGMQFLSAGRIVAREARPPAEAPVIPIGEHRARRASWIPAVAAAALMLAITTPVIVALWRNANAPAFEVASQQSFLSGDARSATDPAPALNGNAPIVLWADVPSDPTKPTYSHYEARLIRPNGPALTLPFTPDANGTPLTVRGLAAGPHELVIVGIDPAGQQAEISRNRFIVRK
jgi:hypothetical protein